MAQACVKALAVGIQAGIPTITWGGPGTGKTKTTGAICRALERKLHTYIPAIHEPADFGGYPCPAGDYVRMLPAGDMWRSITEGDVVFLDEISCAPPAVQAALLRPVLEGCVGDLVLPPVSWVAAANPPEQAAGGWNLAPPLANRFCHVPWRADVREWRDGMIAGFPDPSFPRMPSDWRERHYPITYAQVASYVGSNPQKLEPGVPKDESKAGGAWASPRTWEMTAKVCAAVRSIGGDPDVEVLLVAGCVGEGIGLEFLHWRQNLDLPDPEDLLADPKKFKLPTRGDLQFTILASVAAAALSNMTKDRWKAAWEVFHQAATQGAKDVAAASVRTLAAGRKKHKDLPFPPPTILKPFMEILHDAGLMVV